MDWVFVNRIKIALVLCVLLLLGTTVLHLKLLGNYNEEIWQVEKCNQFKDRGYNTALRLWKNYLFDKHHLCLIELEQGLGYVQIRYACRKMGQKEVCEIIKEATE